MEAGYRGKVLDLLRQHGLQVGDRVIVKDGKASFEGILMPRSELDDEYHLVVKLDDGYNLGISIESLSVQKLPSEETRPSASAFQERANPGLPKVSIISTGGTIASKVDYKTGAVSPALTAQDLYQSVPELGEMANIRTEILYSLLSENLTPEKWSSMARSVAVHIKDGAQGVVITHGTDTMGYTAAALSFALRNLPVPVVLVGSQRSSDRPSSDASLNLKGAVFTAANAPFAEVCILMHEGSSDKTLAIHRGTRVRKFHTSRRDAFRTVNALPLARVADGRIETFGDFKRRRTAKNGSEETGSGKGAGAAEASGASLELKANFDEDVVLIKSYPGIPPDIFDPLVHRGFHGIVLEGTGLGHIPTTLFNQVKRAVDGGLTVVMTSQCIYGRVNMNVYSTGRELLNLGVIPAGDMLPETALVKLMWVLGQTADPKKIREMFLTDISGEMSDRSSYLDKMRQEEGD
jgi:glutamyl-tRNA(Gln) amidotransferase subunit D